MSAIDLDAIENVIDDDCYGHVWVSDTIDALVAEVRRLREWSDSYENAMLKERRLAEERIRETEADNKRLRRKIETYKVLDSFCGSCRTTKAENQRLRELSKSAATYSKEHVIRMLDEAKREMLEAAAKLWVEDGWGWQDADDGQRAILALVLKDSRIA